MRFRQPRVAVVFAAGLLVAVLPLVAALPPLLLLALVPLALLAWALRSGTDADADGLVLRGLVGSRTVPWGEVDRLDARQRGLLDAPVQVVLTSGEELGLPQVARAELPLLRAVAEGRDPGELRRSRRGGGQ